MSEARKLYFCEVCGNLVEVVLDGGGELVCCGEAMTLLDKTDERSLSAAHELVIDETPEGVRVTIGNPDPHAMTEAHFIQWIEAWVGNHVFRKELKPGDTPTALFQLSEIVKETGEEPRFRAYCNLHGLRFCGRCENA